MKIAVALALVASVASLTGCDKAKTESVSMTNDLKAPVLAPPPPAKTIARGGIPDDSVKPVNPRGGVPDDSIKPLPLPLNPRGGVPDDSIKPVPKP